MITTHDALEPALAPVNEKYNAYLGGHIVPKGSMWFSTQVTCHSSYSGLFNCDCRDVVYTDAKYILYPDKVMSY